MLPPVPAADLALWTGDPGELSQWRAQAARGSRASLGVEAGPRGAALRFDFALEGHGAFAIARREVVFDLPAHYAVAFALRGEAAPVELQLKLVDPTGSNVWWWRRRDFAPARDGEALVFRRANLEFAWGPRSGGDPDRLGAVELAVASDRGVAGTLWIEGLRIEAREQRAGPPRALGARASSSAPGHAAQRALESDPHTSWRPDPADPRPWLELDLGARCEWGGLRIDFAGAPAAACRLLVSDDAASWTPLTYEPRGSGAKLWLCSREAESRYVRVELPAKTDAAVARVGVVPLELALSPARYAASQARSAPRGLFPRHLLGEHGYWALVAAEDDTRKGLLGEDGALETGAEGFSLEPFLEIDGRCLSWADATTRPSLADGGLPIPSLAWDAAGLRLDITAWASGQAGQSALVARYAVENPGSDSRALRLWLAIRPFQVTPAWQSLNLSPAVAPISRIESRRRARARERRARGRCGEPARCLRRRRPRPAVCARSSRAARPPPSRSTTRSASRRPRSASICASLRAAASASSWRCRSSTRRRLRPPVSRARRRRPGARRSSRLRAFAGASGSRVCRSRCRRARRTSSRACAPRSRGSS